MKRLLGDIPLVYGDSIRSISPLSSKEGFGGKSEGGASVDVTPFRLEIVFGAFCLEEYSE